MAPDHHVLPQAGVFTGVRGITEVGTEICLHAKQVVAVTAWAGGADFPSKSLKIAGAALLEIMADVPEFADEAALLAAVPGDAPLREIPEGSRTGTSAWTVYDAAIRTAAYFLKHQRPDSLLTEREVAAHALPGSKEWTPARRAAFELLVGQSAGGQLVGMDHDIRVRGRLRWSIGPVVADAMRGHPWIGLPSGGIHVIGQVERDVRGVLVVENADTFQYVCQRPDVTDTWLCVWGRGSATDGVVNFLRTMDDLPIAAWCDLDARGIEIVTELAERLGREITPVGMSVELFVSGKQYVPKNQADSLSVAKKMASFAGTPYAAGRRWARTPIDVSTVAASVQLSKDGHVIRVHPIRRDRSRELGAFANPKGRPRRKNSAIGNTG